MVFTARRVTGYAARMRPSCRRNGSGRSSGWLLAVKSTVDNAHPPTFTADYATTSIHDATTIISELQAALAHRRQGRAASPDKVFKAGNSLYKNSLSMAYDVQVGRMTGG